MFNVKRKWVWFSILVLCFMLVTPVVSAISDDKTDAIKPYIESVAEAEEGLSLWQMLASGGFIMLILAFLSVFTVFLIVYQFMTLKEELIIPKDFTEEFLEALEKKDEKKLTTLCDDKPSVVATIIKNGLEKKKKGVVFVREAIENSVRKELGKFWQHLSYLADVANVAPLIGLLGTVLGMIQAFNVIAFQSGVVKPILLAGGVSKAMVTTAGGLIVAIPAFLFYSYFRGRIQNITDDVETFSNDVIKSIETQS